MLNSHLWLGAIILDNTDTELLLSNLNAANQIGTEEGTGCCSYCFRCMSFNNVIIGFNF